MRDFAGGGGDFRNLFSEVFARATPVLPAESPIVVAGSLLRFHDIDVLHLLRDNAYTDEVVAGYAAISGILHHDPTHLYPFIWRECSTIAMPIASIEHGATLADLLSKFVETRFGFACIHKDGMHSVISINDLLRLYKERTIETDLRCSDVASPVFRLPREATCKEAFDEMLKRRIRRVFIRDGSSFVSDRTLTGYFFSPMILKVLRNDARQVLGTKIQDTGPIDAISVDGRFNLAEAADLLLQNRRSCLLCGKGVVTPWDCLVKPFQMNRLSSRQAKVI